MNYIHRELERKIAEASRFFKAVLVTGARQVGNPRCLSIWRRSSTERM